MGKLEDAVARLERAIARLERAADRIAQGEKSDHAALLAAQADHAALSAISDGVAARLDAAIGRLDRVLEA
jgi:exonuclease VII small subunit